MKGIKIMMIVVGVAALILLYLAVNAMIQTMKVQKERPLKIEERQEEPAQYDTSSRRRSR